MFLQRAQETNTTYYHVKVLNTVVKRLQTHPHSLRYAHLGLKTEFLVLTDSAFKKEEDTGHALKGTLILRRAKGPLASCNVHIVDYLTKRVGNVTRSTFSAELFGLCDACDHALLLRQICHEFQNGPLTASQARDLREGKTKSTVNMSIAIDAMSVFAAVTASHVKIPSERSLLSHLQYVRELLDRRVLESLTWLDTRDMAADGMTKGSIARDAITDCMNGSLTLNHSCKSWRPLVSLPSAAAE